MWTTPRLDFYDLYGFQRFGGPDGWILEIFIYLKYVKYNRWVVETLKLNGNLENAIVGLSKF